MKKFLVLINLWLPVLGWGGLIFFLSSVTSLKTAPDPYWDAIFRNILHLFFWGVLAALFFRAVNSPSRQKNWWLPFGLAWAYGLFDELHQAFVPTRTFQKTDLFLDGLGSFLGSWGLFWMRGRWPEKVKRLVKNIGFG